MNKFINIEGCDAAGKSLQTKLIRELLEKNGKKVKLIHFPMYGHNEFSEMISKFLRGDYGKIDEVDPIFITNIYAMDRYMYKKELLQNLEDNDVVIMDRYVYSNMAYQGAKIEDEDERDNLIWQIYEFEFDLLSLPKPDLVIFFDVPIEEIKRRLNLDRKGNDRDYLNGKQDIHEENISFQKDVRKIYLGMNILSNFKVVKAYNDEERILSPGDLFNTYKNMI